MCWYAGLLVAMDVSNALPDVVPQDSGHNTDDEPKGGLVASA